MARRHALVDNVILFDFRAIYVTNIEASAVIARLP